MTWSIVARDTATGGFGVAVATRFFAVGALCPNGAGGVGALATQALINPLYGPRGVRLLADGFAAADVVAALTGSDPGRESRQLHVIDAHGRNAAFTGAECVDWCGHALAENVSVAGNMLAGPAVVADTLAAYQAHAGLPMAERLIRALEAGEAAGGDKRGKQSAALKLWGGEEYTALDLRVDDHPDPLAELRRLYEVANERFVPFSRAFATRDNPGGVTDRSEIERFVAEHQEKRDQSRR
ncbi:DUF1028 domain-containing protein [Alsobacter sp. SYSU M60028]|uniref:DUF1028 domain-containing protein n=1 Tax=Alsobacter ponti TaxID=2962936 RepID=A0ABT1LH19_9HYPH|nr:DUF1028 domain-containing protein [Alsobacter ponti]MCP8940795.1 DUF1028 domain-containing protein [Alsobacter ponti]